MNRDQLRLRPLTSYDELQGCVELQKSTWGSDFDDIVSAALMHVSQKIGGISAGAFDGNGHLVATIFGLTGIRNGRSVHWSHMLAVEPAWRGRGVGAALKAYQRRRVMDIGVRTMYWTFDPLEARNAHFNLNRLRARIHDYVVDAYGAGISSPLHSGIGTDRFVASWALESEPVTAAMSRLEAALTWSDDRVEAMFDLAMTHRGEESPQQPVNPREPAGARRQKTIEIPMDIQRLKAESPEDAVKYRQSTRKAFVDLLAEGYEVTGFISDRSADRGYYVLEQSAGSSPDPDPMTST